MPKDIRAHEGSWVLTTQAQRPGNRARATTNNAMEQSETQSPGSLERVVRHPAFDADGYPSEETELAIKSWDFRDVNGWLTYIRQAWNQHYGRMWEEGGMLKLATGGWSGNEAITHSMRDNYILWAMLWESSHRGGLEVLRMPNDQAEASGA